METCPVHVVSSDGGLLVLGSSSVLPWAFVKGRHDELQNTAIGFCSVYTPQDWARTPHCGQD